MAFRVAVVGAGPAGFYACEELLRHDGFDVDLYDALPTPFGLVRAGVAPDHPKSKTVTRRYEKTTEASELGRPQPAVAETRRSAESRLASRPASVWGTRTAPTSSSRTRSRASAPKIDRYTRMVEAPLARERGRRGRRGVGP